MTESITHRQRGPHPGILATVSLALTVAGIVIAAATSGGDALSSPYAHDLVARVAGNHDAVRVLAFFQFGAAVPLGILAATFYARLVRFGVRVPGPAISLVGGVVATMSLLVAAFVTFVESRPEVTGDAALTRALAFLAFVAGGPGYAVGVGLLVAGIAVPALILGLVPHPLAAAGLVLAVLAELSWFGLLAQPMQYLLPIARFGGGMWLVAAGFLMPASRPRRTPTTDEPVPEAIS